MKTIEGMMSDGQGRYALVAGRFNSFIVERLVEGAVDTLRRHGVGDDAMTLVRVPGAWEIPLVCRELTRSGDYDAVIALGCVIRGATPHFDHVAGECSKGLGQLAQQSDVPVIFGVLTCDTIEQAVERAGTKAGNKGADAAAAALEMVDVMRRLKGNPGA